MARGAHIPRLGGGAPLGGLGAAWLVVVLESAALVVLGALWAAPRVFANQPPAAWAMWAALGLLIVELLTLLLIPRVRAVAMQTFHQCVRTRIAVTFIVLLAACLGALPFIVKGDGTLAGKIRALLSWGTSIAAVLLGLVTIFLGASVVSSDLRDKRIFITATKPLARWQYLLGRWLGVVLVVAMLLAIASAGIYAYAQYLREDKPLNDLDRLAVETEVLAARGRIGPVLRSLDEKVGDRIRQMKENDPRVYRQALDAFKLRTGGDERLAEAALLAEIRKQEIAREQSRGYGAAFLWRFEGLQPWRRQVRGKGTVLAAMNPGGWMRIRAGRALARRAVRGAPIQVMGRDAIVGRVRGHALTVGFRRRDVHLRSLVNLKSGQRVDLVLVPIIHISFKATASGELPRGLIFTSWSVGNPQSGLGPRMDREDPVRVPATLRVSATAVSSDGQLEVQCINNTPASIKIDSKDVFVLFAVGSFEWNYVRGVVLVLLQLLFLAACGVFAGSFLSFPVASLICFALLPFSLMRGFLSDSLKLPAPGSRGSVDVFTWGGHYALQVMKVFLPDFAGSSPSDAMIDGMYIPWTHVGETAALTFGLRVLCVLALGCLLFWKRELARVQV